MMILFRKNYGFRQKIKYFLSVFKTGNIERIPGPKTIFEYDTQNDTHNNIY